MCNRKILSNFIFHWSHWHRDIALHCETKTCFPQGAPCFTLVSDEQVFCVSDNVAIFTIILSFIIAIMRYIFDKTKSKFNPEIQQENKEIDPERPIEKHSAGWEWYDPPQDSAPVMFCKDTTLHGLQYLGQKNRHMCERLFWFTACTTAVIAAIVSIWQIWSAYFSSPMVTVFNPTEITLDQIPFPAVTICNVNNIQKSKVDQLRSEALEGIDGQVSEQEVLHILSRFRDIYHVCDSSPTFTERFGSVESFGPPIDKLIKDKQKELEDFMNPIETIRNFSQSCKEMILFCMWQDKPHNCRQLFQEVETDYGICCTFNTIPLSLLRKSNDPITQSESVDDLQRVAAWKEADVNLDKLIKMGNFTKVPYRQRHAGRGSGLSILLNPDVDEYFCANTDSEGFVVSVNVPLTFPRMKDNGIAVRTNSEVFISVKPEITMTDDVTKKFSLEKRKCYFNNEFQLRHYTKYTISNCMDECIARKTRRICGCVHYYMPRGNKNKKVCKPDQYDCTNKVREDVVARGLKQRCRMCLPTCTEIEYHTGISALNIRKQYTKKLFEKFPEHSKARNVSIVHVYFNVDSTIPKLRKEMMSVLELISNAGGLLGIMQSYNQSLCLGFSMLSLLEIIYYVSIRLFCNKYRERSKRHETGRETSARVEYMGRLFRQFSGRENHNGNFNFPTKLFLHDATDGMRKYSNKRVVVNDDIFNTGSFEQKNNLPDYYFQTSFEKDFKKAYNCK